VDFFRQLAEVKKNIPSLQFIFKFRPGYSTPAVRAFIVELFPSGVAVADYESIFPLLLLADMVISGPSTVLCEAMIAEKPLILSPWRTEDIHLGIYRDAGVYVQGVSELQEAIRMILEHDSYRTELIAKGKTFLSRNYVFDGQASKRTIQLLRENLTVYPAERL
jgi:CDP-glycerol glycerophosphotransferase (TagB/SpsB family)